MKKKIIVIFAFANIFSINVQKLVAENSTTTNLVTNPGFENWTSGTPDGWTIVNATNGAVSENSVTIANGSKSLKVTGGTGTYSINQLVPVIAGKTYRLQMKYFIETGDGTDARIWCNFKNSSGAFSKMSLADSLALKGPNWASTPGYFSDVRGAWQIYTYDVTAPVGYDFFSFEFRTYRSPAIVYWDDMSFSEIVSEITTSTSSLSGFQYTPGSGPSSQQQFIVGGTGLSSGLTITAPSNYEISALSGTDFTGTSSMNIPASNGTVSPLTLFVRLKSGLSENIYTGDITISSSGITPKTISLTGKVKIPPSNVTLSLDTLKNFQYFYGSGPSSEKSFVLSGNNLTTGIVISVPTEFEVSALSGSSFIGTNSITIPHNNGVISNLNLFVRMKSGLAVNSYSGIISFTTSGSTPKTIVLSGNVENAPVVLNKSVNTLTNFGYNYGNGPSLGQYFTLVGTGLIGNVVITAPTYYELSSNSGISYSNSLTFTPSGGTLITKTIYVRLKSGLSVMTHNGNITISTNGAATQTISLTGSVVLPAGISVSVLGISDFTYEVESGPSVIKSFDVYGGSISSFLIITSPANYEISTTTGVDFAGTGQVLLQPTNGVINGVTIYCRLKAGLTNGSYDGSISLTSSGYASKSVSLTGSVTLPPNLQLDSYYYEPRNGSNLVFRNIWLVSNKLNNYNISSDLIAPSGTARGMVVKDGKMLFIDRANKQIMLVSGSTGRKLTPILLDSNMFTYTGRTKDNSADSILTAGVFGFNDIKVDNAGNVLVSNLITSNTGRFQIWKVNMTDGTGSLLIDQSNLATLFPTASTLRFDYFNVYGDINSSAIILAANASYSAMEVYKWVITDGIASNPVVILLDNSTATGKDLAGLANLGSGPQVFPIDNNSFYVDGNATFPVRCGINGNVLDGFNSNLLNLNDTVTTPGLSMVMNKGHNGMKEFQIGDEYFFVMAATNTSGNPPSSFRIFKFADASKSFANMQCLWTFPQQGMGAASNVSRMAMPAVEVSGNTARIYVYTGENGYGLYELTTYGTYTGNIQPENKYVKVEISYVDKKIKLTEKVDQINLYTITGNKLKTISNSDSFDTNLPQGIYIVCMKLNNGTIQTERITIK